MAILRLLAFAALCLALAGVAMAAPQFSVQGSVYCDTCRAGFVTSLTKYLQGAKVKLECRHFEDNKVEYAAEGVTDSNGGYKIDVQGTHDEDICEVILSESPMKDCSDVAPGRDRARIVLSAYGGLSAPVRYANALGFLKDEPLEDCGLVLQQYALGVDD